MLFFLPHIIMFVGMLIFHLFAMPFIMIYRYEDFYLSMNQLYMGLIMSLFMVLLESFMHPLPLSIIIAIIILIILLTIFVKKQTGINKKQYLRDMIPHHSMALQTSEKQINEPVVGKLAQTIFQTQIDEIYQMKKLLLLSS